MDKEKLRQHLELRQEQLRSLINSINFIGKEHPGYSHLPTLENEKQIVDSQLERLEKLM